MTASAWTEDRIDRLKTLWLEGQTAEQIARDLANGITRSAVLGKVYRMGLSAERTASPPRPGRPPRAARAPSERPAPAPRSSVEPEPSEEIGIATLLSVRRLECRWPLGDPREPAFALCGRGVARGAYCAWHAEIAYRPVRETPQALARLAGLT